MWASHERKHHSSRTPVQQWLQHSSRVRTALGIPRDAMPWSDLGKKLHGVGDCSRKHDLINVAWAARVREVQGGAPLTRLVSIVWCDLSQSVVRKPWGLKLRSFKGRAQIYSYEFDRVLSGVDCMKVHGWPQSMLSHVRQSDFLTAVSEGTSLPMVFVVKIVLWSNPWGSRHQ